MQLSWILKKAAPGVPVMLIEQGNTDPATFKRLSAYEAQKEYITSDLQVKDLLIDKDILIITI